MDNLSKMIFDDINKMNVDYRRVFLGISEEDVKQALIEKGDIMEGGEDGKKSPTGIRRKITG